MNVPMRYFDALYADADDPWRYRERWYEQRKRDLTLAALPSPRYGCAYEPGCSIGELSACIAARVDSLLASDGSDAAVQRATARLAGEPNVRVEKRLLPEQWPDETFDLILFSELGYYFSSEALSVLIGKIRGSLSAGGVLLACHWRHGIEGCSLNGDGVHAQIHAEVGLHRLSQHQEQDFIITVWSGDPSSVALREGFI